MIRASTCCVQGRSNCKTDRRTTYVPRAVDTADCRPQTPRMLLVRWTTGAPFGRVRTSCPASGDKHQTAVQVLATFRLRASTLRQTLVGAGPLLGFEHSGI